MMKRAKKIRPVFFKPDLSRYVNKKLRAFAETRNGKCFEYRKSQLGIKP